MAVGDENLAQMMRKSGITENMLTGGQVRYDTAALHNAHSQYRKMRQEWRNYVYLGRSGIQGLGLYAKRDLDMNTMIIEYVGEIIRSELGEVREKKYLKQNRAIYLFRIDDEFIIDATMTGGLARYINHSCDPNCCTKVLQYNDEKKIVIIANRPIKAGEELAYDYQFELEDNEEKLACLCGAPNCVKWMN
jgi:SET domain-containing protein